MHKKFYKNIFLILVPITVVFLGGGLALMVVGLNNLTSIRVLEEYRPAVKTRVYDSKGRIITEFFREKRNLVDYDRISPYLVNATLSIEDKRFFSHYGIDPWRIIKAILVNLIEMRKKEGGSTITIQLSKVLFLDFAKTFERKFRELWYAVQIEKQYSKKEILYLYLNQLNYGHGYYGVEAASRFYFDKSAEDVSIAEAALLSGIPKSPVYYSPKTYPDNAKSRHRVALQSMVNNGYLSQEIASGAFRQYWLSFLSEKKLQKDSGQDQEKSVASHFVEYIRKKLERELEDKDIYKHGLNVYTTLDLDKQRIAEEEVEKSLEIQNAVYEREKKVLNRQKPLDHLQRLSYLSRLASIPTFDIIRGVEREFTKELILKDTYQSFKAMGLVLGPKGLWDFFHSDFLDKEVNLASEENAQAAMIALDPSSGYVRVMIGGPSFDYYNQFNRAMLLRRQVGSLLKPFVYAISFEDKILTPSTLLYDLPTMFGDYVPKNYDGHYRGPVLVRQALSKSINVLAVEALSRIGIERARNELSRVFRAFSEEDKNRLFPNNFTLALGTGSFSPLDMAVAYAVLANEGREVVPKTIRYVTDANGQIIKDYEKIYAQDSVRQLFSEETAFLIANITQDVFRPGGTAYLPTLLKDFAHGAHSFGKTGTTSNWVDAWFAGANKHLAAVVWVGYDDNRSLGKGRVGGRVAAPIWINFQKKALLSEKVLPIRRPTGVVAQRVCKQLGLLAGPYDREEDTYLEYFHYDNVPKEICNYNRVLYEEEAGLIRLLKEKQKRKESREVFKALKLINNNQNSQDNQDQDSQDEGNSLETNSLETNN